MTDMYTGDEFDRVMNNMHYINVHELRAAVNAITDDEDMSKYNHRFARRLIMYLRVNQSFVVVKEKS